MSRCRQQTVPRCPLVIIARRGLALNGKNPTILYGYGSYGFTIDPAFSPPRYAWLERGGIFAIAGVRGGGERGDDWHMAGFKASKTQHLEGRYRLCRVSDCQAVHLA